MWRGMGVALAALLYAGSQASAHGGGGGGGFVYVPMFIGSSPSVVPIATAGDYSHIHTVAIISAIGNGLLLHDPLIWSAPDLPPVDISSWGVDAQVENELTGFLGNRFTIKHVDYDRAGIEGLENGKGAIDPLARLRDKLHAISNDGIDAFIVVRPDVEGDMMGPPGLGVESRSDIRPTEWANYEIDIIDAHTLAIIGHAASRLQTRVGGMIGFPGRFRSDGFLVDGKNTPTPEQLAQMRKDFSTLVPLTLVSTLRALNLGVTLPDPGARVMVPLPEKLRPKIKNIAVISAVGDSLILDHRGAFFVHDTSYPQIPDWNLDREIEADVTAALDKRFTVKPMTADRAKLAKLSFPLSKEAFAAPIDGLTSAPDIDAYVLIIKAIGYDPMHGAEGPGIMVRHWTSLGGAQTNLVVHYAIAIVDPKSLLAAYIRPALTSPARPTRIMSADLDNADWPEKGAFEPGQAQAVHKIVSDQFADSIPETLMFMGLTGMIPSSEPPTAFSQGAQAAAPQPASTPAASTPAPAPPSQTPAQ